VLVAGMIGCQLRAKRHDGTLSKAFSHLLLLVRDHHRHQEAPLTSQGQWKTMKSHLIVRGVLLTMAFLMAGCAATTPHRDLTSMTQKNAPCYDRKTEPYTAIVDSHIHFRAFGGESIPFTELNDYFNKSGVLFANVYGIGQILPTDSPCIYYLDCPGTPALPSIKNDFVNAANIVEHKPKNVHLTLSMTFPDLASPENIVDMIHLYDKEFPQLFKWMGEVNLIKQALLANHHVPATRENIERWADFMAILKKRGIPINIHADLGNNAEPTKFLSLMEYALSLYPDNKVVWAHMGLSKELTNMKPAEHIRIMQSVLDKYPNLMLDISWRVLYDTYFSKPEASVLYVEFFNKNSKRILPGTDFVASRKKQYATYQEELAVTSSINQHLSDEAFRNIALGENYFRLLGMDYQAPQICAATMSAAR
jgi:predicted TIM-barrel fold metal-dependent hydrolase